MYSIINNTKLNSKMSAKAKPRLSKGILEMKFMMKSKVKVDKEEESNQGQEMYRNEITHKMGNSNFIQEPGFVNIEELSVCRYSCRGMNPEIEKLLQNEQISKDTNRPKMEAEVSDKEMVHFYSKPGVANTKNKNAHKRKSREESFHKNKKDR